MTFRGSSFIITSMSINKGPLYTVIFYRFIIATIILVVNTAIFGLGRTPVYFFIAATYFFTIIYSILVLAKVSNPIFLYGQIILDLIIETGLIHYTGGIDSVLGILYPLSSIAASILISPRAAIIIALLGSTLYTAIVSLEFFNIIPLPLNLKTFFVRQSSYVFSLLYFRVTIFCIIGFLSAYISEQVKKKDQVVLSLQRQLRREDRLSAIGRLAASTAHEIRNPLASISGCAEALSESLKLGGNDQKLFNVIMKETSRLNNIINGLLEYVKPKKLQLAKVSLDELIEEVIFLIQNNKDFKKGVSIHKETNFDNIKVVCDGQQIKQVLFNLLVNAVETVKENGKIIINGEIDKSRQRAQINIIDNGKGIEEERLESIFEPFASGKDKGVGLGLSIALSIMKEHGGNIELESKVDRGSTFRVVLPLKA